MGVAITNYYDCHCHYIFIAVMMMIVIDHCLPSNLGFSLAFELSLTCLL